MKGANIFAAEICGKDDFLLQYNILKSDYETCGVSWEECNVIYKDYLNDIPKLTNAAEALRAFIEELDIFHLVKVRVKDPNHLVDKVIRKNIERVERNDTGPIINSSNYGALISDQIGARGIHLFKKDFANIHPAILRCGFSIIGLPEAYVAPYEKSYVLDIYKMLGLKVTIKNIGYRSVHYSVEFPVVNPSNKFVAEFQVRTLYEEAWGEIDHKTRYPYLIKNERLTNISRKISEYSGLCDELADVAYRLSEYYQKVETGNALEKELVELLISCKRILEYNDLPT